LLGGPCPTNASSGRRRGCWRSRRRPRRGVPSLQRDASSTGDKELAAHDHMRRSTPRARVLSVATGVVRNRRWWVGGGPDQDHLAREWRDRRRDEHAQRVPDSGVLSRTSGALTLGATSGFEITLEEGVRSRSRASGASRALLGRGPEVHPSSTTCRGPTRSLDQFHPASAERRLRLRNGAWDMID